MIYLSEHAGYTIVHSVAYSARPVVSPLDERAGLERITAHLVNVRRLGARLWFAPKRERQTYLILALLN